MEIADLLGHTNDRTTRAHYLMEAPEAQRRAMERLDRQVRMRLSPRSSGQRKGAASKRAQAQTPAKVTKTVTKPARAKKKPL